MTLHNSEEHFVRHCVIVVKDIKYEIISFIFSNQNFMNDLQYRLYAKFLLQFAYDNNYIALAKEHLNQTFVPESI